MGLLLGTGMVDYGQWEVGYSMMVGVLLCGLGIIATWKGL